MGDYALTLVDSLDTFAVRSLSFLYSLSIKELIELAAGT